MLTQKEKAILRSIKIASENNPRKPEFPPEHPRFPATPAYKIKVPGFTNVWLKDESVNLTGTHKDRMAWEMVVTYRQFLLAKQKGLIKKLPQLSILSSGSAAFAVQTKLRHYRLPNLRVLMDLWTDPRVVAVLKKIGCRVFLKELGRRVFNWEDILLFTDNENGFDITSNEAYDPTVRFYDWMSYEILNVGADYVFIPFGTGQLYENVMNIVKREVQYNTSDPRFRGNRKRLRACSFCGATTNDSKSKADKLYAPFLPFANYSSQWVRYYVNTGIAGAMSGVYPIRETYLEEAMVIAEENGVICEPSGIAGLALMLQLKSRLPKDEKMLVVNTGKTKY